MDFFYKGKKVERIGGFLQGKMKKSFLWRGIEASQVGEVYKELALKVKELKGTQFVSWRDQILKIRVGSAAQRQAIILNLPNILKEIKERGIDIKELKINFK